MSLRPGLLLLLCASFGAQPPVSPIHFRYQPIPFTLQNDESPRRHAPETMAGGVAVFDYDNDGDLDIFFASGANLESLEKTGPKFWNRLFANDGKGHFTDVTEKAGLKGLGYDTGVVVGDYDNDGCKDLFIAGVHRNTLYHNNCDGTFTDVTAKAGLATVPDPKYGPRWAVSGAWLDVNNDGLLDLFVVNYLVWDFAKEPVCKYEDRYEYCHPKYYRELPNQLYLNKGNGTFEDVSEASGIRAALGKGMGVGVADFDLDGRLDLFVSNDKLFNSFFQNRGGGKFEENAFALGVALAEHGNMISGMGVDFRDIDNDGYPDIVVVALDNETFPIYHNTGKGGFQEITSSSGVSVSSRPMAGYSPNIVDFDNDGWKDIFVTRGHVQSPAMEPRVSIDQPNTVFRNLHNLKFEPLTAEAGLAVESAKRHRGSAVGDFNGDGKMDVVVTALSGAAELWLNDSPGNNNWLAVQLRGTRSNRDAVGARVKVVSKSGTQYDHVVSTSGYASSSAGPLHFGLGPADTSATIEIQWPSGIRQVLEGVKAGQLLQVVEPKE